MNHFDPLSPAQNETSSPDLTIASSTTPQGLQVSSISQPVPLANTNAAVSGHEVVFVDSTLANWQSLLSDIKSGTEVIMLDPLKNGVTQMADALQGKTGVTGVHIVSHGGEGYLVLGNTMLSSYNLADYQASMATIHKAMAVGADIMLYGCDVAKGDTGASFVQQLAKATGADVAASTNDTGIHGDWVLEYHAGNVETATIASQHYQYDLATIKVTNLNDSGAGSLRAAVAASIGNGVADTIVFDPGLFASGAATLTLTSGALTVDSVDSGDALTIVGPGENLLTISGNNSSAIFDSASLGTPNTSPLTISGMTLTSANGANGAVAMLYSGSLTLDHVAIRNNSSTTRGAGVFFYDSSASVTISNTTIANNTATATYSSGNGGGAYINAATVTISGSTISGNAASNGRYGGGISVVAGTSATLTNLTIANNSAGKTGDNLGGGGGISLSGAGTKTLTNSTIVGNSFVGGNGAAFGGGGLYVTQNSGAVTLKNTIIANNSSTNNVADDDDAFVGTGASLTGSNNLIISTVGTNGSGSNATTGTITSLGTALGTLANNGGAVQTIAILSGSNAINAGTSTGAPTTDARGFGRGGTTDIGAFESSDNGSFDFSGIVSPANGVTDVPVNYDLVIEFGEAVMAVAAKNIVIYRQSDNAILETIAATDSSKVTFSSGAGGANSKVTINPTANFAGTTGYYVLIDSGAFKDGANKTFNGISSNSIWTFTSAVPPAAVTSATYDASTGTLTITGTDIINGGTVDVTKLSLTGQAGSYTLTSTPGVTASSTTTISFALNATDKLNINGILNKNGTSAVDTTTFNLAAAANWMTATPADLTGNAVTVSNVTAPTITSATYNGNTHVFTVTGTNLVKTIGATNDVTISKLTITGEGGATYTLSTTGNVEVTSATSFTFTLAGADIAAIDALLNKNGTSAVSSTTYNIAAADDWNSVITGGNIQDLTGNGITVSNAAPSILSSTYDALTGILSVSAVNIVAGNIIDVSKLVLSGQSGNSYTLTTPNVTASSATAFSVTLNATDKLLVNGLLNKNGTTADSGTVFNLNASAGWDQTLNAGADTVNVVTVSNVAIPTITSATYNGATHVFTVTGTNLVQTIGAANDITISKLTITGEGGATRTLSTTSNVEIISDTSFSFTLAGVDISAVDALLNKSGTSSVSNTSYNIAAADDWNSVVTGGNIQDLTGNAITVSNPSPIINSATYDATTGVLTVSALNIGAGDTINSSSLWLVGQGHFAFNIPVPNVTASSNTSFSITLGTFDRDTVNGLLNKNGASAVDGTAFDLIAVGNWDVTLASGSDNNGNPILVSNLPTPTITFASYDVATHILSVIGTNIVKTPGAANDINVSKITITGDGGASYTLSSSSNVEAFIGSSFSVTLAGADIAAVEALLNKNGSTSLVSNTTYNIAVGDDWNSVITGGDISDLTGNSITVMNARPGIGYASYSAITNQLTVRGNFNPGDTIDVSKLSITGQGGSYTLTSPNVTANSWDFSLTLNAADALAINGILNKNGTTAVDGTTFNLAAAANWNLTTSAPADLAGNIITTSFVSTPRITSATYDGATKILSVTGHDLVRTIGPTNDITVSKLTVLIEGGASYTLSTSSNVEITSSTSFSVTLTGADIAAVDNLLNKNGVISPSIGAYKLNSADDWNSVITGGDISNVFNSYITVSNAVPNIVNASYSAYTGVLSVSALNINGGDTIDVSKLSLIGQAGGSYTLTSANVTASSGTTFSVTLNAADKLAVNGLLNKSGTTAVDGTGFNLAAATGWDQTLASSADLTGNVVTAFAVTPTLFGLSYDATTHVLHGTGMSFVGILGANNDITVPKLSIRGEGGASYTLTSANVDVNDSGSFDVTLNSADQIQLAQLLNKNGGVSTGGASYGFTAADDWNSVINNTDISVTSAFLSVSNVVVPTITSSTYDAATGVLIVTGTGLTGLTGAANDIVANKFSLQGEGGTSYTLTTTSNVEISSATSFTLTLSAADRAAVNLILNKNGTSSTNATTYNLTAAEDWAAGADAAVVIADLTGNGITVSNVAAPTVTSMTYHVGTGVLVVTGTGFSRAAGVANDIVANKLTFLGQGGGAYALTDTANVDVTSGTSFTMTLSATDKAAVALLLNKDGTSSVGGTTYNVAFAEDWALGADVAVTIADLTGNGVTVTGNNVAPTIGGTVAGQAVTETTTVSPFTGVTITDPDVGASETIIISLDTAAKGAFTAASLAATGFSTADGGLTYTHAADAPTAVQAAIRGLVFQPAAGRVPVGGTETTTFTISANDGIASAVLNNSTTVISTGINAAPTNISLSNATIQQGSAANTSVGTLTAIDPNPGDTASFTLVSGNGANDRDNSKFSISGNTLIAKNPLGMTPGNYTIFVRATDTSGAAYEKSLVIAVGDNVAPVATGITRLQPENTNLASVDYKVSFSEAVTGVNAAAFALATTGTVAGTISNVTQLDSSTYSVRITGLTGDGTLGLNLKNTGTGIVDTTSLALSGGFTGQLYQVDHTAPTTSISSVRLSNDDGISGIDFITSAAQQTISGTLSAGLLAGETVQVSLDHGANWMNATAALGSTSWTLQNQTLGGNNTLQVRVTDLAGNSGASLQQGYSIVSYDNTGTTNPTDNTIPVTDPDADGDGILQIVEAEVPNWSGSGKGDGNGDGKADQSQKDVGSLPWNNGSLVNTHYATLSAESSLALGKVTTTTSPGNLPSDLQLQYGLINSQVNGVGMGKDVSLSLYTDKLGSVNGYWVQDRAGNWTNIASAITEVNGKLKVDFKITDGGMFDADGKVDGKISFSGGLGFKTSSLPGDKDGDGIPDAIEAKVGTNQNLKDNDVLHRADLFAMQLYRDVLFREGDTAGITYWQQQIDSGHLSRAQVAASMLASTEFQNNVGSLTRLYFGAFDRLPDRDGLAYWIGQEKAGASLSGISGAFVASAEFQSTYGNLNNTAFVDRVYQNVLHRSADAAGQAYWLGQLNNGLSRGDMLAGFTESAEFKASSQAKVSLTLDYIGLLGHAPDQATFNALLAQGNTDVVTLIGQFLNAPDYLARFMPT